MKQLFLYFLFFVGAALILLQCGRMFPTVEKKTTPQLADSTISTYKKDQNAIMFNTTAANSHIRIKRGNIAHIYTYLSLPYQTGQRMKVSNILYKRDKQQ
jgi:hypothetical protein